MSTPSDIAYLAQLQQEVRDNRSYRSNNSVEMCRKFVEAIEGLLAERPSEARSGGPSGESLRFDMQTLLQQKRDAEKWLSGRNVASGQITHLEYCGE